MCKVLDEREKRGHDAGFAEGLEQGVAQGLTQGREQGLAQGIIQSLISLVKKGHLTLEVAAKEAKMTPEAFLALMEK